MEGSRNQGIQTSAVARRGSFREEHQIERRETRRRIPSISQGISRSWNDAHREVPEDCLSRITGFDRRRATQWRGHPLRTQPHVDGGCPKRRRYAPPGWLAPILCQRRSGAAENRLRLEDPRIMRSEGSLIRDRGRRGGAKDRPRSNRFDALPARHGMTPPASRPVNTLRDPGVTPIRVTRRKRTATTRRYI